MSGKIDLHIHTSYSDGLASPQKVLDIVRKRKLAAFAICDHDNLNGYIETRKLLREGDPELVPGVELSAGKDNEDIHILGYYIDSGSKTMDEALADLRERRNRRGQEILEKLKDLSIDLPLDLVKRIAGYSAIGRPHIADALVEIGAIRSYETAFHKYIGHDCPAYVPKENLTPAQAIHLIHQSGGLAFLAHPGIGHTAQHINEFIGLGIDGIEIYHPKHDRRRQKIYADIARSHSLLMVGGSDFHDREGRYSMIGSQPVPVEWLEAMKEKLQHQK